MAHWWDVSMDGKWCHDHHLLDPTVPKKAGSNPCGKASLQEKTMLFNCWASDRLGLSL